MTEVARAHFPWRALALSALAWLVPASGHFLLRKRARALGFLIVIAAAFSIGLYLDGNLHRVVSGQPLSLLATSPLILVTHPSMCQRPQHRRSILLPRFRQSLELRVHAVHCRSFCPRPSNACDGELHSTEVSRPQTQICAAQHDRSRSLGLPSVMSRRPGRTGESCAIRWRHCRLKRVPIGAKRCR